MANQNEVKKPMGKALFVERETYEKNGKSYFSYFIKGVIRGKEVRVALVPPDNGEVYECAVKPFRASDKTLLQLLLR